MKFNFFRFFIVVELLAVVENPEKVYSAERPFFERYFIEHRSWKQGF